MATPSNDLIGCLIKASTTKRTVTGVVLPPKVHARSTKLRLAISSNELITFDPEKWTITVLAGPLYGKNDLPAELLATRTMLRAEQRREPALGQRAIARYRTYDGAAPLFAVIDTQPLAELSPLRATAWAARRTCERCGDQRPRPLPKHVSGSRYCGACCAAVADDRWTEQSRGAQADAKLWAVDVLNDPAALLITHDTGWPARHFRVETTCGTVVLDARVRDEYTINPATCVGSTPDEIAAWNEKFAGTVGHDEIDGIISALAGSRLIGWHEADTSYAYFSSVSLRIAAGDVVSQRLALFSGVAPPRFGPWYEKPKLPWVHYPPTYPPYTQHKERRAADDRAAELCSLRHLIHLMAEHPAPEPTLHRRENRSTR